jgi:hypothetical protein
MCPGVVSHDLESCPGFRRRMYMRLHEHEGVNHRGGHERGFVSSTLIAMVLFGVTLEMRASSSVSAE